MPTRRALPAALAAVLLAAGCGGSDSEFRERAEAVCFDYAARIDAVATPRDLSQLVDTSGRIADLLEQQLAELRKLEPPAGLTDDYAEWLRLTDEAVGNARAIQAAAREEDQERISTLAGEASRNELAADRLARDLKLPGCMVERA